MILAAFEVQLVAAVETLETSSHMAKTRHNVWVGCDATVHRPRPPGHSRKADQRFGLGLDSAYVYHSVQFDGIRCEFASSDHSYHSLVDPPLLCSMQSMI